jgi:site-specific recombinase XerD
MARPRRLQGFRHEAPLRLPERDAALLREMLDAYSTRRLGALRHTTKSVARDVATIHDLVGFTGKPPWSWTEQDFDAWCYHIGVERRLAMASQRHYQATIRTFLGYLTDNIKFRNDVRRLYGIELQQICHADNCIPHTCERELRRERRAMTHEEIAQLFSGLEAAIAEAAKFCTKSLEPLRRDKVLFFCIYALGLRASEALGLDCGSFMANPAIPSLGKFGLASVWGKGSRGSGPRLRTVAVDHPALPGLLEWYLNRVRPTFVRNADANEEALFLSERGRRLGLSSLEARFQVVIDLAGLGGRNLTPHCLRHSSVTHGALNLSLEAVRRKHGHVYAATTQGYIHLPDDFIGGEIAGLVNRQVNSVKDD